MQKASTQRKKPARADRRGRGMVSAQQTIPYVAMYPDGVCQLPGGLFTKAVEYEDINYSVASSEDQSAIFNGWSAFLNYFDSALPFQLSFVNRRARQPVQGEYPHAVRRIRQHPGGVRVHAQASDRQEQQRH